MPPPLAPYYFAFSPPYKGLGATVRGMSWARAAIFYGSDRGREILESTGASHTTATLLPTLLVSTVFQCVNMPLVRATILLQDPQSTVPNIRESLWRIYNNNGLGSLWHGTSAGILKTFPKYCTAVYVKDYMERTMPPVDPDSSTRDRGFGLRPRDANFASARVVRDSRYNVKYKIYKEVVRDNMVLSLI